MDEGEDVLNRRKDGWQADTPSYKATVGNEYNSKPFN